MSPELERQEANLEATPKRHTGAQQLLIHELRKLGAEKAASTLEELIHGDASVREYVLADLAFLQDKTT